jgi:hypothetical protein
VADWQSDGLRMRTLLDNAISTIAKVFGSFSLTYELGLDAPHEKRRIQLCFAPQQKELVEKLSRAGS